MLTNVARHAYSLTERFGRFSRHVFHLLASLEWVPGAVVVFSPEQREGARMSAIVKVDGADALGNPDVGFRSMLGPGRERRLLEELCGCRRKLAEALAHDLGMVIPRAADGPGAMSRFIVEAHANRSSEASRNDAAFRRFFALRAELALANMRLVAHVARRYRHRGVAYSDLVQEGFCGLLQAIDRFDLAHETKLATYATWWIRQAIQCAVAAGAHPVRLTPRHLRQLAEDQDQHNRNVGQESGTRHVAAESIQRIRAAARPAISLDETRGETHFRLVHTMRDAASDRADDIDLDEALCKWMESLRPRERQVLSYRFGLRGSPQLSLSKVGQVLGVSKERVRQIQEVALKVLRTNAPRDVSIETN
jgi:RNA polymerase primary sigma factor